MRASNILVVDDDPDILELVEVLLGDGGYRPLCHADGESALAALNKARPAMAVLDVLMPVMDGHQLAIELRRRLPQLPILFITGFAPRPIPAQLGAAPTALLHKPFRPQQLLTSVAELLHQG